MKKYYFFFAAMFLAVASFGQTKLSIRSGLNITTTKNIGGFIKNRAAWYGGASILIPVHKNVIFQPELIFSSKGHRVNRNIDIGGYKSNRFNYLNMPVLLNYRFDKKTSIVIGPEFGYLLSVTGILVGGTAIDLTNNYPSKLDIAISMGLQYKLIKKIGVEIRYNYGFNTLYYVDDAGTRYSEKKGAHRVFQIGMRYSFLKPKK